MILWGYWRSSATWRVRIGLHTKGVAYDHRHVDLRGGAQHGEAHRARNPMGQVPVLEVGGERLTQSLAILRWLDATHPEPPLLPGDPMAAARAWEIAEIVNAGVQPLQNLAVIGALQGAGLDGRAWARQRIAIGFAALEGLLGRVAGRHAVGDAVSIADLCLVPQVYNARRFGVALEPYPELCRIERAASALPAFVAAHPDNHRPPEVPS